MPETHPSPAPPAHTDAPRVAIVGGGTAGWMAAAALTRFAPGHRVTLVESETIGTVGVGEATIPQIRLFNAGLGIEEADFLAATKASFKLGIEFDGWHREGEAYMHAFGLLGRAQGPLPFQQLWAKAQADGFARPLKHYSLNAIAAYGGRMRTGLPEMPYAYHFDAGLYAALLRSRAEAAGAVRVEGLIERVDADVSSETVQALVLENGQRIEADWFIDCSGFRGLLIEGALQSGWDDWSHWLPCDRAWAVPCANGGEFTPYTRASARAAGWQWRIPLQHRIGNGHVYSSAHVSDDEAADTLLAHLDGKADGDPRPLRFTTGMRKRQWVGNCVALGLAAGFLEPLESTSIHLVQSGLSRLLSMLPGKTVRPALRDAFNAQAVFEWSRVRDFLILHYHANERRGEPFWDDMRAMALPDTLEAKLDQWRAGAFIHREHEDLFTEPGWMQVLVGQGFLPEGRNAIADSVTRESLVQLFEAHERAAIRAANAMPTHAECVAETVRAAAPAATAKHKEAV